MRYLHLTRWREWEEGRIYETNWEESNYWTQKKRLRFIDGLDRVVQELKFRAELLKEYVFEHVRMRVCPGCPSRFNAMFLIPLGVDIGRVRDVLGMRDYRVVGIEVVEVWGMHEADISWLDCNLVDIATMEIFAGHYWRGERRSDIVEVLFRGRFKIFSQK